ncbi:uncharacterized protein RJT20DRAFT_133369 [Scheffersomyces xylosifermentans]|uniref:uncharacterized protein n=1 Tax=Scheffersomyces xylosifermentans TaxID=1304137 RepID=UPI00315D4232
MDSSTVIFIITLAVAFIFLRWLIAPIPQSNEFNVNLSPPSSAESSSGSTNGSSHGSTGNNARSTGVTRNRRQVTDGMIEVVSTIAPSLTRDQIIMDLNNTGSVEVTINRYMELGGLPFPPGADRTPNRAPSTSNATTTTNETPANAQPNAQTNAQPNAKQPKKKSINLLEKYDIKPEDLAENESTTSSGVDKNISLQRRKQEMILSARRRLEAQLKNEQDWSQVMK